MKLLYLYIRDYGILKNVEFNFDSEYRFHFDKDTRELTQLEPENQLDDDFFSINKKGNDRVIESVSAIIGNNGAGKTSVAKFLDELGQNDGIIIYKKNHKLYAGLTNDNENNSSQHKDQKFKFICELLNIKEIDFKLLKNDIKTVYCSNAFITQNIFLIQDDNFIDLSTSNLVKNAYAKDKDHEQTVDAYCSIELNDNIRFFTECNKHKKNIFDLPTPIGINIFINENRIKKYIEIAQKFIATNYDKNNNTIKRQYKNIIKINDILFARPCAPDLIYFSFLIDILFFQNDLVPKRNQTYFYSAIQSLLNQLKRANKSNSLAFEEFFNNVLKNFEKAIEARNMQEDELWRQTEYVSAFKKRIEQFNELVQLITKNNWTFTFFPYYSCTIDLLNEQERKEIMKFIDCYYNHSDFINRSLNFSWSPRLSAGEYAQLSLYSRLFSIIQTPLNKNGRTIKIRDNIIVFFDEIEITIHPELQRELVSNVIKFFEIFFEGCKVHLFFASHSPVLLSDIPKSNVCFLERTEESGKLRVENITHEIEDNTFGANIHSLYRHSFFMKDGSMGALADRKINEIIKKLKPEDDDKPSVAKLNTGQKNDLKRTIELIGEPVIRAKLMNMFRDKYYNSPEEKILFYQKEIERLKEQECKKRNRSK
jgi:hypothetical protein